MAYHCGRDFFLVVGMYRPVKVRYADDHPFFYDMDLLYAKTIKNSSLCFYESLAGKLETKNKVAKFPCGINGCNIHFTSVEKYIVHYEAAHRFSCAICSLPLPSPRLLDLHVREVHDNFFRAQNERQPMFECLVEKCPHRFFTHKDRGDHLVSMHLYPPEFNDIIIGKKYVKQKSKKSGVKSTKQQKCTGKQKSRKKKNAPRSSRRRQKLSL